MSFAHPIKPGSETLYYYQLKVVKSICYIETWHSHQAGVTSTDSKIIWK